VPPRSSYRNFSGACQLARSAELFSCQSDFLGDEGGVIAACLNKRVLHARTISLRASTSCTGRNFDPDYACRFHYEFGPIHFIHYSTEHAFGEGSTQHAFVADTLASIDRRRTPWVIFAGHRPMYIDSTNDAPHDGDQTVATDLRAAFEKLLKDFAVDVTLHGHHHSYQRTCPVYKEECVGLGDDGVPRGPVHLVIGTCIRCSICAACTLVHIRSPILDACTLVVMP
jgi:Calcineurin-like phosphoesterase